MLSGIFRVLLLIVQFFCSEYLKKHKLEFIKNICFPPAAFSKEHLLCERWLLGSGLKGSDGCWRSIMEMDEVKQSHFVQRVFFLHALATARSSNSSQNVRMSMQQFEKEVDIACLGIHVLTAMANERNPENNNALVFTQECLDNCRARLLEGFLVNL